MTLQELEIGTDFYGQSVKVGDTIIAEVNLWGLPEHERLRENANGHHDGVRGYVFCGKIGYQDYKFILKDMRNIDSYQMKHFIKNPIGCVSMSCVSKILLKVTPDPPNN